MHWHCACQNYAHHALSALAYTFSIIAKDNNSFSLTHVKFPCNTSRFIPFQPGLLTMFCVFLISQLIMPNNVIQWSPLTTNFKGPVDLLRHGRDFAATTEFVVNGLHCTLTTPTLFEFLQQKRSKDQQAWHNPTGSTISARQKASDTTYTSFMNNVHRSSSSLPNLLTRTQIPPENPNTSSHRSKQITPSINQYLYIPT